MPLRAMLDANILSAIMRDAGGTLWQRAQDFGARQLCTSVIVAGELEFGAVLRQSPRIAREVQDILATIAVLPLEEGVARTYGRIRADLQRRGTPIGPNDVWIAAHALTLDLALVTGNVREFSRVPGLRVENWLD
jgi:tRNA(fMet)-specific endonuclease VapC